ETCELYRKMERIIIDEAPVVPLFYDEVTRFKHKYVIGLKNNAMNMVLLKEVKLDFSIVEQP
ncbi:MAG TPA: hypothetical protein PLU78_09640, partial [Chitinophagales bacterium]|nr:hypothetical protein [Chitinophagales bacterium]